ncbi:mucin-5AC-like [Panonychus citri]|uniref:mucin-5AC-like n=1 Tax=Panonychus citri TaxID=50023 RepID=UPI002307519C|nr:mucin-5AC-like [Panonychus citri]
MFSVKNFLAFNSLSIILITVLKVSNAAPTTINSDDNQINSLNDIETEYKVDDYDYDSIDLDGDFNLVSSTPPTLTSSTFIYYESTHHDDLVDSVSNKSDNLPNDFVTENTKTTDYIETIKVTNQDTTQSTLDINDSSTTINDNKKLTPPLINPFEDFIFEPQEIEPTTRKTIETDQQLTNFDTTTRSENLITDNNELIVDGQTAKVNNRNDFWISTVTQSTNYDDETTKSSTKTESITDYITSTIISTTDGQQLTTTDSDDYQSTTFVFTDRPVTESIQVETSTINLTTDQRDDPTTIESINSGSTQQITEFISTTTEMQQSTSDSVTEMISTQSDATISTTQGQSTTTTTIKSDEPTIVITETPQFTVTITTTNMIQSTTSDSRSDISAETTTIASQLTSTISDITTESIIDTTTQQIIELTTVLETQTEQQLTTTLEPEATNEPQLTTTVKPEIKTTTESTVYTTTNHQDEPEITKKLTTTISPGIETTTESMVDTTTQQTIELTTVLETQTEQQLTTTLEPETEATNEPQLTTTIEPEIETTTEPMIYTTTINFETSTTFQTQTEPQLTTTTKPETEATTEPMIYTTTEQLTTTPQDEPETTTQLITSTTISEITTKSTTAPPTQTEPQLTTTIKPETEATTADPQLTTTIKPEIQTTEQSTTQQPDEPITQLITTIKPEIGTTTQSTKTESITETEPKTETTTTKIEDITTEPNIPCDCDQSNFDERPDCQFICTSSSFFANFHINLTFFGLKIATILSDPDYLICIALGLGFLLLISGLTLRLIHRRKQRKLIAQRNFDILYQDFGTINEKDKQWLADFKYQSSIL